MYDNIKFIAWNVVTLVSYRVAMGFLAIGGSLIALQGHGTRKMRALLEKIEAEDV